MRDRAIELRVGLLIAAAAVILASFVFLLGNFSLSSGYRLYVDYRYSGNLREGAPVKVSGIKVGKVEEVRFLGGEVDEATGERVQVRLVVWLEDRVRDAIRRDAEFFINTAGVLGEQYLEIVPGNDFEHPPLEPESIARGVNPPRTDLLMARLYDVLDSVSEILRDDRDLVRDLIKNSSESVRELNLLLRDNREELGKLIASADDLAREGAGTLRRVNEGLGDPRVIGNTLRHADALLVAAEGTLREVTPPTRELMRDARRVTGLVTEERVDRAVEVADSAVSLGGKAGSLVDSVHGMVTDLRAGRGTAGALLAREELYADLRELIRDLKRHPWKFFWKE